MQPRFSFQQIDKPGAKWGIKCSADLGRATRFAGQTVLVTKRSGEQQDVKLGRMIDSWNGGRAAVYMIDNDRPFQHEREREQIRQAVVSEGRKAREELEAAKRAFAEYDPADFEYFDGETEIQEAHERRLVHRVKQAQAIYDALRESYRAAFLVAA